MRPFTSGYAGPIVAGLLLFSGTCLWAWVEHQLSLEHDRVEARRHIEGLANTTAMLAHHMDPADDAAFAAALETSLQLRPPLHFMVVERDGQALAQIGDVPELFGDITDPDFEPPHGVVVTRAVLGPDSVHVPDDLDARPPRWRWQRARGSSSLGGKGAPLELYLASEMRPPPQVVAHQRQRLAAMLVLSWFAIIGFVVAWIRSIRSRDLAAALDVERRERARLGDLNLAAAGLAHETMNPLGLIHGFAQQLANDPGVSLRGRDTAEQIVEEADRAAARLSDFINFARHVELELSPVSATAVIGRVADAVRPEYESAGIELELDGPELTLSCDRAMLEQVLVNLLLNSLVASGPGTCTRVSWTREGPRATMTIADQGRGISPSLLPDVFKPYVTGREDGHGLGLAIVKQIVDRHGWSIDIHSEPGLGTRVCLAQLELAREERGE